MENKTEILICGCNSIEHQLIIRYSEDETDDGFKHPMCYLYVHLSQKPFWKRVVHGIKYIFGYQSNYGAFDEFIFDSKDANKLQDLVDYLNREKN